MSEGYDGSAGSGIVVMVVVLVCWGVSYPMMIAVMVVDWAFPLGMCKTST